MTGTSQRRRQDPTPWELDRRVFSALQVRADDLGDEKSHHEAQAEFHWQQCCWHLARADDAALSLFDLTAAMARVARRLIKAQADGTRPQLNGRAA